MLGNLGLETSFRASFIGTVIDKKCFNTGILMRIKLG